MISVFNQTRKTTVAQNVREAYSLWARGRGLLGTSTLEENSGLWLRPCKAVHTFFMSYPIETLFLNRDGQVIGMESIKPWRLSSVYPKAAGVIELPLGTLVQSGTEVGDQLQFGKVRE